MNRNVFNDPLVAIPVNMPRIMVKIFQECGGVIKNDEDGSEFYNIKKLDPYKFALSIIKECSEVASATEQMNMNKIREKILFSFELINTSKYNP